TTIWSSTYPVPSEPQQIPVGRPIANTQMYVVDHNVQPVAVGVTGELLIGGAGVARGYLGRPELTAEKFVPSPFAASGTNRLYRTGDLARFLPDGNIELLGRIDHQVKIRGHRVELGEIETRLNEHPTVSDSVVVAHETGEGHKQLVAYVIPRKGEKPAPNQLRRYAGEKLPDYMLPSKVVFLAAFPQTPNRKIDRKALAAMEPGEGTPEHEYDPPGTAVETAMAEYWRELLTVPRVGRHDNFFELGGDSLLALHLAAWVRDQYEVDLPLRSLFEHPTVAGLAAEIEARTWSAAAPPRLAAAADREEVEI
ncbi:MAG: non-ribosomal peptide synthetase, partial [Verrucomicrobia bacterium]